MKKALAVILVLAGMSATPANAQPEKQHYYRVVQGRPEFTESFRRPAGTDWMAIRPRTVTLDGVVPTERIDLHEGIESAPPEAVETRGPIVAVIDTGIDETHSWFTGRLLPGAVFSSDGAGLNDLNGHGTHVAGIVARENPAAHILPIRALDRYGTGDDYHLAQAVTWAVDNGASVINMSLGAPWQLGDAYVAALDYAEERNVVVVAASGNEGPNAVPQYPAAYPEVLAVTAVGVDKVEASFAQRGDYIDIAARGINVLSAIPGGTAYMSGTSMATPAVSATVSILRTMHPEWTAADLRDHITNTAEDVGRPGRDNVFGAGVLDKQRAVTLEGPLRSIAATSRYVVTKVPGGVRINSLPWQPHQLVVRAQRPDGITRTLTARTGWRLLYDEPGEYRVHAYDTNKRLLGWETVLLTEPGGAPVVQVKPSAHRPGRIALRSGNTKVRTIAVWEIVDKRFVRPIASVVTGRRWTTVHIPAGVNYIACYKGVNGQTFGCHRPLYKQPLATAEWPITPAG